MGASLTKIAILLHETSHAWLQIVRRDLNGNET